jgi:16S rRNA (uracil1498-N3)-methyltransferase
MLTLAEKAVELSASLWRPVVYRRSRSVTPRGEGSAFAEKTRIRMVSALEQCGGAWLPRQLPESDLASALASADRGILLDGEGDPFTEVHSAMPSPLRIALGPEGGIEPDERASFERAGWRLARLGDNVLRFETAGIAALAIARTLLLR